MDEATVKGIRPAGNVRNPASRFRQPRLRPRVALFPSGIAMVSVLRETGCSKSAPTLCWDLQWFSVLPANYQKRESRGADSNLRLANYE